MVQLAGEDILASDVVTPTYIKKAANESRTSNITPSADADFVVDLPVGVWEIRTYLSVLGAAAGDLRIAWSFSGTATVGRAAFGPGTSMTSATNAETVNNSSVAIGSNLLFGVDGSLNSSVHEQLLLEVTVAGTLTMLWAQSASSGTATTLSGSSRMMITKVETN